MYKLLFLLMLSGCATQPRQWFPHQHMDMMAECKSMCSNFVKRYDPYTGQCECKEARKAR